MVAPEMRVMVNLPSNRQVMGEVRVDVFGLVGERVVEFQEEHFCAWFGDPWQRRKVGSLTCYQTYKDLTR
jgi:hypothetical protein